MTVLGSIAGGSAGTLAMTTLLRVASEVGLTRMDIPFLLGTAVSVDRTRAKVVGYALHFAAGLVFSIVYYALFVAIDRSGWWLGSALPCPFPRTVSKAAKKSAAPAASVSGRLRAATCASIDGSPTSGT